MVAGNVNITGWDCGPGSSVARSGARRDAALAGGEPGLDATAPEDLEA